MHRSISAPSQDVSVNLNKFNYRSRPSGSLQKLLESQCNHDNTQLLSALLRSLHMEKLELSSSKQIEDLSS